MDHVQKRSLRNQKKAYVDEEMFAHDDTVKSVTVDGKEYPVTVVTDEVMGARKY